MPSGEESAPFSAFQEVCRRERAEQLQARLGHPTAICEKKSLGVKTKTNNVKL